MEAVCLLKSRFFLFRGGSNRIYATIAMFNAYPRYSKTTGVLNDKIPATARIYFAITRACVIENLSTAATFCNSHISY